MRRVLEIVGVIACGMAIGSCGNDDPAETPTATSPASTSAEPVVTTPPEAAAETDDLAYLALGDSLSRGVEPEPSLTLRSGYPRQLASALRERTGGPVALVEAGCGGATTVSFIEGGKGCPPDAPVPYANTAAETSQLAWAENWLRSRGDRPTVVTLSLGANDVLGCAGDAATTIRQCLENGAEGFAERVGTIVDRLGQAAGTKTVFAGMTLYDPLLGAVVLGKAPLETVGAFHDGLVGVVNPFLRERLDEADWQVADLGAELDEDAYLDSPQSPAINAVCKHTWACTAPGDIHLNRAGYALAAELHEREILRPLRRIYPAASG